MNSKTLQNTIAQITNSHAGRRVLPTTDIEVNDSGEVSFGRMTDPRTDRIGIISRNNNCCAVFTIEGIELNTDDLNEIIRYMKQLDGVDMSHAIEKTVSGDVFIFNGERFIKSLPCPENYLMLIDKNQKLESENARLMDAIKATKSAAIIVGCALDDSDYRAAKRNAEYVVKIADKALEQSNG